MAVIEIRLVGARLALTSTSRSDVQVEGPANVEHRPDRVVISELPAKGEVHPICHVQVPTGANVDIVSESGSVTVYTFQGTLRARLQHGAAQVERAEGRFRIVSGRGPVTLENVRGTVDVLTSGGDITAEQIDGEIQAVSDAGNMKLEEINGPLAARSTTGTIKGRELRGTTRLSTRTGAVTILGAYRQLIVRTHSGDITLDASVVDHTTLETQKGSVDVRLGKQTDARISAAARQGVVRSERLTLGSGTGRRAVQSVLGDGRARLRIETGMGVIDLAGPRPTSGALVI